MQIERMRDGQRRIVQISEVIGLEGDVITTNDIALFEYQRRGRSRTDIGRLQVHAGRPEIQEPSCLLRADRAWAEAMRQL